MNQPLSLVLPQMRLLPSLPASLDMGLVLMVAGLISIGIVAVSTASIGYADQNYGDPFYFLKRYSVYLVLGLLASWIAVQIPLKIYYRFSPAIFAFALLLLALVLIPGVGREINGSRRWLAFGPLSFQVAEFAKLALIVFLSGYLVRRGEELRVDWRGFSKPILILSLLAALLLMQPDFGSIVVLAGITFGLLFVAGIHLVRFVLFCALGVAGLVSFVMSSDYRMERVRSFIDPWADQFDGGYQLVMSLIAFGRGEWFGVGLGNSVQKLFYLPEAHTDFVFSIISEELGLVGAVAILVLMGALVMRLFRLGAKAINIGQPFGGYIAIGTALLFGIQTLINVGVACGLMPTKGLTFPFVSYGGSSLLICVVLVALCLRVDLEVARAQLPAAQREVTRNV